MNNYIRERKLILLAIKRAGFNLIGKIGKKDEYELIADCERLNANERLIK